jgi:hypothetical protein
MKLWTPRLVKARLDRELLTRERPSKWDDMAELSALLTMERGTWKEQMHELWLNGDPINIAGGLAGLEGQLSPATDVTITPAAATATLLYPAVYTPLRAGATSPTIWQFYLAGAHTTAATPGSAAFQCGIGAVATNLMGSATTTLAETASQLTSVFRCWGYVVAPRTGGGSTGANSTAVGYIEIGWTTGTAAPGVMFAGTPLIFGGVTASSYDSSIATNFHVDVTVTTSSTNTYIPRLCLWGSWN